MPLEHQTLEALRQRHPAWRLLCSDHAALVASFLERVFITPNQRSIAQAELAEALEDDLYWIQRRIDNERDRIGMGARPGASIAVGGGSFVSETACSEGAVFT